MSSRYQSKKSNIVNKENESGPLNMIKKVQQTRKEAADKKPLLKPSKSLALRDNKFADALPLEESSLADDLPPKDNKEEERKACATRFKRAETDRVMAAYSKNFIAEMKSRELKYCPQNFLDNHKISQSVRAKMIDWMIEVLCSYKCSDMTFFIAVYYMDGYFKKTAVKHELNDLHLVGVSSMFLATKFEEISPLRISVMQSKISHGKFTKEEIKSKETDIIQALNFDCCPVTILNFLEVGIETLKLREALSENLFNHLVKLSVYISKMVVHEYELLNKYTPSEFAVACIYIGLKIVQQLEPAFKIENYAYKLRTAFDISENAFFDCSQNCLELAKNFETKYPSLTNLAKFHSFTLEGASTSDIGLVDDATDEDR